MQKQKQTIAEHAGQWSVFKHLGQLDPFSLANNRLLAEPAFDNWCE